MLPVLLIAFGAMALLNQVFERGISVFWLIIGLWLLARARATDHYPVLVVGAVLTGAGAGNFVGDIVHNGASEAIGTLGTASGFFWLATADRRRSSWAMIPAFVIGLIGLGQLGLHASDVVNGGAGGWLLPAGVVVAGVLLLGAHRLPGPVRLAGLVFVGAAALSLVTNQDDGDRRNERVIPTVPASGSRALPVPGERTVVLRHGSGDISVVEGDEPGVRGRSKTLNVEDSVGQITITGEGDRDVEITVPHGTKLKLSAGSGSIEVDVAAAQLDLSTGSGDIVVMRAASRLQANTGSGDIEAVLASTGAVPAILHSSSGDVELTVTGDPTLTVTSSSGDIEVIGFDAAQVSNDNAYVNPGSTGSITVTTTSGDVIVERDEDVESDPGVTGDTGGRGLR